MYDAGSSSARARSDWTRDCPHLLDPCKAFGRVFLSTAHIDTHEQIIPDHFFFLSLSLVFSSCIPVCMFIFNARVPSSVQQPSDALTTYVPGTHLILRVLSATRHTTSFVPYRISEFFCFFFRLSTFLLVFCCALVPGTLALDLPSLILQRLVFLCLTVCDHRICVYLGWRIRKDTAGTADVVGRKSGLMWRQQQHQLQGGIRLHTSYSNTTIRKYSLCIYICIYARR